MKLDNRELCIVLSHEIVSTFKLTHIVDVEKLEIIIKNSEKQTF